MPKVVLGSSTSVESGQRISLNRRAVPEIISEGTFAGKLFVFNDLYEDIERVYDFCKGCPKRAYKLAYIDGSAIRSHYSELQLPGAIELVLNYW